jgi:Lrp/AsnC family leucine-responsive transcriptional regulator
MQNIMTFRSVAQRRTEQPITHSINTMANDSVVLDRINRQILQALQHDGRLTNVELATRIHLSPAACLERVRRLQDAGFIRGYHAILNPEKVGASLMVFIEVVLDRTSPTVFDDFKRTVVVMPEILECHMVAGGFDYLLKARVADMNAYRILLDRFLRDVAGVRQTHTYTVMEEVKHSTELWLG